MSLTVEKSTWSSIQKGFVTGFEPIRKVLDHTNAMSDALDLFVQTFDIASHFAPLTRLKPFAESFRNVERVTALFNFKNRLKDVCSGAALKDNPSGEGRNWIKFASKISLLVYDGCGIVSFMSQLRAFSSEIHKKVASVKVFGKQVDFNALNGLSDSAALVGGTLAAVNYIREGKAKGFTPLRSVSLAFEIDRVAGVLLSRVPAVFSRAPAEPFAILTAVSYLTGSVLSLTAFFLHKYRPKGEPTPGSTAEPAKVPANG